MTKKTRTEEEYRNAIHQMGNLAREINENWANYCRRNNLIWFIVALLLNLMWGLFFILK